MLCLIGVLAPASYITVHAIKAPDDKEMSPDQNPSRSSSNDIRAVPPQEDQRRPNTLVCTRWIIMV